MKAQTLAIALILFPALLLPGGLDVCACDRCPCERPAPTPSPCCGGPRQGDDRPCVRAKVEGIGPVNTSVSCALDVPPSAAGDVVPPPVARVHRAPRHRAAVSHQAPRLLPLLI